MFQRLLVAIDGSKSSLQAAEVAISLASLLQARLDLLSVEETLPRYVATHEESSREHLAALEYFEGLQAPLRRQAQQRGVQTHCAILGGHEGQVILEYIKEQQCDLLVLGHQGHSAVWGAFLGSTADKLVNHAPCSVLVIRSKGGKSLFRRLLVGLDGSPLSWQAFQVGLQLAKLAGATLTTLSVIEGPKTPPKQQAAPRTPSGKLDWDWAIYFQQMQARASAEAHLADLPLETFTREGSASTLLTSLAQERNTDLLILGATGHEHPLSSTTGGTARKVANAAPCAVLLVRPLAFQSRVRDLMTTDVIGIPPQTQLTEIIGQLIEQGNKILVVVNDEKHVVGVITLGRLLTQGELFLQLDMQQVADVHQLSEQLRQLLSLEKRAEEVMIQHPLVCKDEDTVAEAAHLMAARSVTRLPVINREGKLVGLLDQAAILHYYANLPETTTPLPIGQVVQPARSPRLVGDTVITPVPVVVQATPFIEVLHQVQSTPLRRVIVVNPDGKAIGVIGDRDLLVSGDLGATRNPIFAFAGRLFLHLPEELFKRRLAQGSPTAQQLMRPHLFAVTPATSIPEALRMMLAHQIKRLVVVDEAGKPLGLVDRQQLLRSLVEGSTRQT
jgi:nucleotide-binding universal stress UspA family protein/predicted transcriptional regulator